MPERSIRPRRVLAVVVLVAGAVALVVSVSAGASAPAVAPVASVPAAHPPDTLAHSISVAQDKLRRTPQDPLTWAQLGSAYVEQARITADPAYYPKAQGALEKSLAQQPQGNGPALIGMGALANARHDFAGAKTWGERAAAVLPDTAEVYGVLADAFTQLGDADAATDAIQRMLDHKPGVSSFTRASYDFELHGRVDDARQALQRALADSTSSSDIAFCRYYLGELAFNSGQVDEASAEYEQGLAADPQNVALLEGRAKVAAATGRVDDALAGYRDVVTRVPLPQYLQEYAELLLSAGRQAEANQQFAVLDGQQRLFAAAGVTDDLTASSIAADRGDRAGALSHAQAEWGRRQNVLAADALGWALHLNGRDPEALTYLDRAGALGWRNATFAYHRGTVLAALGRHAEAVTALSEALATNPHFSPLAAPGARTALDRLKGGR
ncbi:tetratricopeptide repeat protein [Amycolatopsis saalfeldensis]|uniref:Tetratricopeptide repeat-containing protein n=1 Tax=Amycolatopsis saalfeldensis TaxID=394193 RepID=A0A1H8U681_9PSEU|nr:tetratricopeptide repeat protein [Amycolatopsis saalfeldensis]SEO98709.1 Tetratricopeptide repeat-containing protein [Amycolatopsis saalfeldensis]